MVFGKTCNSVVSSGKSLMVRRLLSVFGYGGSWVFFWGFESEGGMVRCGFADVRAKTRALATESA